MKRFLLISLFMITGLVSFSQEENEDGAQRIRDRMNEYIQRRLRLSKDEAVRFTPVFIRYFKEWRFTLRENKGDRLILQQKIVDLRLRYRTEFREILGEKRGGMVYDQQEQFIREMREVGKERLGKQRPIRDNKGLLFE